MQNVRIEHVSETWWKEACKKVKNSIVFVDNSTAECIHWNGGLSRLLDAGAKNVKEFSSFESGQSEDMKAVFLLSSAIRGTIQDTLQHIIQGSSFQYVSVITSAHTHVHAYARFGKREVDDPQMMQSMEQDILTWMGNMNYTVEILYFPLVMVPHSEGLFLMPSFVEIYPLMDTDVPKIAKSQQALSKGERVKLVENLGEVEFHHLPHDSRILIRQLVMCLHSLFQGMDAREEIFTIGHTARIVGTDLDALSIARQRRKTANNKLSLVIVDRTLDLIQPSSQAGDTHMQRILSLLPKLPGHTIDSAVNMHPLCNVHPSCEWTLLPGSLSHMGSDVRALKVLSALTNSSKKEALALLNSYIVEAANRKNPDERQIDEDSAVSYKTILDTIKQFGTDQEAFLDNAALLQQGLAVVESHLHPRFTLLDQLLTIEKLLLMSIGDAQETPPFTQIFQLLKTRSSKSVTLEDILALMVHVVAIGGPEVFTPKAEYTLKNVLSQAIVEEKDSLSEVLQNIVGEDVDEVSALKASQAIAAQLHAIAATREHLKNYRNLHSPGSDVEPASCRSLLKELVKDCLIAPQAEMVDLEYKSAGLKDFIKTGFSLFVNVSKPMPRDAPLMLVLVLGGITPGEVKDIRETVTGLNTPCQVVLLSSHLAHPSDTIDRLFNSKCNLV